MIVHPEKIIKYKNVSAFCYADGNCHLSTYPFIYLTAYLAIFTDKESVFDF